MIRIEIRFAAHIYLNELYSRIDYIRIVENCQLAYYAF